MSDLSTIKNTEPSSAPDKLLIERKHVIIGAIVLVVILAIIVALVILAVKNPVHTETFRDIAIIALAAESALIGLALLVLIVQVARLTNMLEFEIKPIITNTADTVSTVRGTATFMSERMVSPLIKASGYAAGMTRLAGAVRSLFTVGNQESPAESVADGKEQSLKETNNER